MGGCACKSTPWRKSFCFWVLGGSLILIMGSFVSDASPAEAKAFVSEEDCKHAHTHAHTRMRTHMVFLCSAHKLHTHTHTHTHGKGKSVKTLKAQISLGLSIKTNLFSAYDLKCANMKNDLAVTGRALIDRIRNNSVHALPLHVPCPNPTSGRRGGYGWMCTHACTQSSSARKRTHARTPT